MGCPQKGRKMNHLHPPLFSSTTYPLPEQLFKFSFLMITSQPMAYSNMHTEF